MRRSIWLWLAAAVLASGCSGDPDPKEPQATESANPEVTSTPPPLPELATQETNEGAAAFVDHYLAVLNYAAHTGDTDSLRALSGDECGSCDRYLETVDATHQAGGAYTGGDWYAGDVAVTAHGAYWTVTGSVSTAAGQKRDNEDSEFLDTSESITDIEFVLVPAADGWSMYSFAEAPA